MKIIKIVFGERKSVSRDGRTWNMVSARIDFYLGNQMFSFRDVVFGDTEAEWRKNLRKKVAAYIDSELWEAEDKLAALGK